MITCQLHKQLDTAQGPLTLSVDFQIREGEILALMGPSGSGKTTLLRLLAGLEHPDEGRIIAPDGVWVDTAKQVWRRPQYRPVGMVFQDYALFPNMNVRENLAYALPRGESVAWVDELLSVMELSALAQARPQRLSGGQQQRVALARALVRRPRLLLLDEPLSALDTDLRRRLQNYLLEIHHRYQLTIMLVSHDLREVYKTAHRALRLEDGRLEEIVLPSAKVEELPLMGPSTRLQGEVIGHLPEQEALIVLIGENVLRVPVGAASVNSLKVGEMITLEVGQAGAVLYLKEE
ncbi:MAG: ATP-binding cassette domain-containing protein [Lewinella sp.]|nr:ATP-binding cassette domain-containing protein [Lewinella sp.]